MKKTDARRLKPDVQQQLRNQAVRLRKAGRKYKEIAEIVGVHRTTICKWFKAYEKEGAMAIRVVLNLFVVYLIFSKYYAKRNKLKQYACLSFVTRQIKSL